MRDGEVAEDAFFNAEQNARLAANAERYYRMMFRGGANTWNLRDRHMADTLDELMAYLDRQVAPFGERAKVVVWEHNSHLGDARATEMGQRGELNVGQLVRERWGREAVLIGQTTNTGTVTAARDWDMPADRRRVRPGMAGSYEALFHAVDLPRFLLRLRDADYGGDAADVLNVQRLERAIGVIYRPETERWSHYFDAHLASQFDAVLHFDETHALEPLERTPRWERGAVEEEHEPPETYPFAV
jgi:erythromycin esterase-like protein